MDGSPSDTVMAAIETFEEGQKYHVVAAVEVNNPNIFRSARGQLDLLISLKDYLLMD